MHLQATLLVLLSACGGSATVEAPAPEPEVTTPAAPTKTWRVLAPSPVDLLQMVRDAGIDVSMGDLVPTTVPTGLDSEDEDMVAVKTGMLYAHMLLGGEKSEKAVLVEQAKGLRQGMETIGTGKGLLKTIDRMTEALVDDTAAREDLLAELDEQVSTMDPDEGWGPNHSTGPLLQAGAWLAGMNVVSQAVVRAENDRAADKLLKRPDVPEVFLKYLETPEGDTKIMGPAKMAVSKALSELKSIADREKIGVAGAAEVQKATGALLEQL